MYKTPTGRGLKVCIYCCFSVYLTSYPVSHIHYVVDKSNLMVGSYGPKTEPHVYQTPVETAPSGMISRGQYTIKSKFTDDDKNVIHEWEWCLSIKKDWE